MLRNQKTIVVGMSGGVDSSVTAMLLKKQGYSVVGVFLNFWADPVIEQGKENNKCCSIANMLRARRVADVLDIPFYTIDLTEAFKQKVVDYFLEGFAQGWTPNPCIMCNRDIKFGLMLERLQAMGGDFWATGHYARITEQNGTYRLLAAKDKDKDQSYFLYALNQEKLSRTLFPLGDLTKPEVKKMAQELNLDSFGESYQESQNLCFYPERTPDEFLDRYLPASLQQPGPIMLSDGKVIGTHHGLCHYTIGQRKGIKLGGQTMPLYVIRRDMSKNSLVVGYEADLWQKECYLESATFLNGSLPDELEEVQIKIRSTKNPTPGSIKKEGAGYRVLFKQPMRAITPGQSAVFYQGEELLGGGIIMEQEVVHPASFKRETSPLVSVSTTP